MNPEATFRDCQDDSFVQELQVNGQNDDSLSFSGFEISEEKCNSAEATRTCVVCMDCRTDISLIPCGHTQCCASCLGRLDSLICPLCRAPIQQAEFLRSRSRLSLLKRETVVPITSHGASIWASRRNVLQNASSRLDRQFTESRISDLAYRRREPNSISAVVQQAEPSTRATPYMRNIQQREARRNPLTERFSDPEKILYNESRGLNSMQLQDSSPSCTNREVRYTEFSPPNVILIGSSMDLMISLRNRLRAIFPHPAWVDPKAYVNDRCLLFVDNKPMRLVVLEVNSEISDSNFFLGWMQHYRPRKILLCADFFNLLSFESVVRLDLEILDFLNVACSWVLLKPDRKLIDMDLGKLREQIFL